MSKIATRKALCYGTIFAVIVALLIAVIVLATTGNKAKGDTGKIAQPDCNVAASRFNLLAYFKVKDGLRLKWFSDATTEQDVRKAITGQYHMLETNVNVPATASVPTSRTDFPLVTVLNLLKASSAGVKLNTQTVGATAEAIKALQSSGFAGPVIFSVPALSHDFNWASFLQVLEDGRLKAPIAVNFNLRDECCDTGIGLGALEYIVGLVQTLNFSATVEIDSGSLPKSLGNIRWFLDKTADTNLIVSLNKKINNNTNYDILTVRNDIDSDRVFYNMRGTIYDQFLKLASTAGSSLLYFNIHPRDAGKIIWSHNTDTWVLLNTATKGDVMMIEGDIMLKGQGTPNQTNIPIMAHDAGDDNNITFVQWIDQIIKVDKGMKLDCKYVEAILPALEIVSSKRSEIKGPVWVNSDILKGPNAADSRIAPNLFLDAVKIFPDVTLSLGWTTVRKGSNYNLNYTMGMVGEMFDVVKDLPQPVTFPVRAEQFRDSWASFDWLLQQSRRFTITVWTAPGDDVTKADMDFIRTQAEASRIYFDLPAEIRPSFVN